MVIDPPPTPPSTSDPANFNARADAFLAWIVNFVVQLNAALVQLAANNLPAGSISTFVAGILSATSAAAFRSAIGVGDFLESEIPSTSAVALTTSVPTNVTSISLPAGDWEVSGSFTVTAASANPLFGGVSATSGAIPGPPNKGGHVNISLASGTLGGTLPFGPRRFVVTSTTPVYLVVSAAFSGSLSAYGELRARRLG